MNHQVLNFITYIRHRACRYTPKREKSIPKGERSISKYVTCSSLTVCVKLSFVKEELLKAMENIKVLEGNLGSLE